MVAVELLVKRETVKLSIRIRQTKRIFEYTCRGIYMTRVEAKFLGFEFKLSLRLKNQSNTRTLLAIVTGSD